MRFLAHRADEDAIQGILQPQVKQWPCGLMDMALVFGTKDCRFESCQGHLLLAASTTLFQSVGVNFSSGSGVCCSLTVRGWGDALRIVDLRRSTQDAMKMLDAGLSPAISSLGARNPIHQATPAMNFV